MTVRQYIDRLPGMEKKAPVDPVIRKARKIFEGSGKTLEELGSGMGYPPGTARRAAWQFLNKINNPTLDALRRFAKAMGVSVKDLF